MAREVRVAIIGDPSSLQRALRAADGGVTQFGQRMQQFGTRMRSVGSSLSRGLTLPLVGFGIIAARELSAGERALAQTQAVIESTGGSARRSVQDIVDLSQSLSDLTSLDDEPIQEAANTLLTFQQIAGETFDEATRATLDLSVAMDRDLRSSAVMVGRALNDPIRGMNALTRVGVQFSDRQREWIEHLVESGDVMGAQRVILAELNTEFGGSAEALGSTLTGRLNRVKNQFEAMGAAILEDLLPVFEDLVGIVSALSDGYSNLAPLQQKMVAGLVLLAAVAGPLASAIGLVSTALGAMAAVLGVSAGIVAAVVVAAVALGVALYVLYRNWESATSMMQSFLTLAQGIPVVSQLITVVGWNLSVVIGYWRTVASVARTAISVFVTLGQMTFGGLLAALQGVVAALERLVSLAQSARDVLGSVGDAIPQGGFAGAAVSDRSLFFPKPAPRDRGSRFPSADEIGRATAKHMQSKPLMTVGVN